MSPPRVLTALLLLIAAALAMQWLWPPSPTTEPNPSAQGRAENSDAGPANQGPEVRTRRQSAVVPATAASQTELQVMLRGLHTEMAWTGELELRVKDRERRRVHGDYRTSAKVAADGRCSLALPSWWRRGRSVELVITGTSPGYRPLDHRSSGKLRLKAPLELNVQPLAELRGIIRSGRGDPIANARIAAFATRAGQPYGDTVGQTGSAADGSYHLFAPPDTPLLVTVTAMHPNGIPVRREDGINDNGQPRAGLLPTARIVRLAANRPGIACHFTLEDAAVVTCTLRWPDATPAADCRVRATTNDAAANESTALRLNHACTLRWQTDGSLSAETTAYSDKRGQLRVGARNGRSIQLEVQQIPTVRILGDLPAQQVAAPGELAIELPMPIVLRAIHRGELQPHARILTKAGPPHRTGPDGLSIVLATRPIEACADFGPLRSPWTRVLSGQAAQRIDLVMANTLVPLDLRFADGAVVGGVTIRWQRQDGLANTVHRLMPEGRQSTRLWLEPGKYSISVAGGHPGSQGFLLPTERDVDLAQATSLKLTTRFGGNFSLVALDDQGRALAGKCVVRTPQGEERLVRLAGSGEPGSFAAETARCADNLEPGPYELVIDLGSRGVHRRYVNITAGRTTPVVLRL